MTENMQHTRVVHASLSGPNLMVITRAIKETADDIKNSKSVGCAHFLGYLKTRRKDSSIPDDCFTCSKILKCM